jgi:hypothetical protein
MCAAENFVLAGTQLLCNVTQRINYYYYFYFYILHGLLQF